MMLGPPLRWTLSLVTLLCVNGAVAAQGQKTLWVSDDVNTTIYHVTLDGTVLSSFHSGSISELKLGHGDEVDTLWAAKEGSNLIMHFDFAGNTIASFPGTAYDPAASAPEGVAVDFDNGTLWIVDDETDLVYNTHPDGTPISSFSLADVDRGAISPQGIACDPTDGTLWIADNVTHRVYNVTEDGALISSFPASAFGPVTLNLQGICVDQENRSLWLTARNTHKVYNVSRVGALHSTLDTAVFGSLNPTGVAVEQPHFVTYASLLADVTAGLDDGKLTAPAAKKLTKTIKLSEKKFLAGQLQAAAGVLGGFQDQVDGMVLTGLIEQSYSRLLLANSTYLIMSLVGP
ncbi:MAG TPA: hypothetical protein VFD43_03855 [Planctomycetota bacterium]|nr:hypothetical protein [Planctomycetota bacterium]